MKQLLTMGLGLMALSTLATSATLLTPCPVLTGGTSGGEGVSSSYIANTLGGTANGCNVLITFNANGSITTTFPNAATSYDAGNDDNLVGIVNNTNHVITAINLSNPASDIFGFDGDGVCGNAATGALTSPPNPGYTFAGGGNPCSNAVDPNAYGGPFVTFANIAAGNTSGTVNFGNGGIAAGSSSWFSLEGPVSLTLTVSPTPEPGSIALLAAGLLGLGVASRRRLGQK